MKVHSAVKRRQEMREGKVGKKERVTWELGN